MTELFSVMIKVLISGALILLSGVFLWQVWRIWDSRTLVLAPFDFLDDGKTAKESGEQFARMIRTDLVQLASMYNAGETANMNAVPRADSRDPVAPMELPAIFDTSVFEAVELKAYGIEFGSIFKSLRRQLESPSEITGNVAHQGDKYSVFVELTQPGAGKDSLQRWTIQYAKSVPEATRHVACRIFRHLAGRSTSTDAELFRAVDDEDFCLFNHALDAYDQYRQRKAVLNEDDGTKLLSEADAPLANLLSRDRVTFPYVHKLAALVYFEKKKYADAEGAVGRYIKWLTASNRTDVSADRLGKTIKARKLQTTPAISPLRPLQPGTSIGPAGSNVAGMICCIVMDAAGVQYILGAAHVFGSVGMKLLQPSVSHGGADDDVVADVVKATPTMAIARLREDVTVDPRILKLGPIKGLLSKPAAGSAVLTYGFDGQRRDGTVVNSGVQLTVNIDTGTTKSVVKVDDAIVTSVISNDNEIGGPVLTTDGQLIGMIFGTGGPTNVILPIEAVLKELRVDLVK